MPSSYPYNRSKRTWCRRACEVLSDNHLCFFVSRAVEQLDLSAFEQGYGEEGHPAYHPALILRVWLYAYAWGVHSSRRGHISCIPAPAPEKSTRVVPGEHAGQCSRQWPVSNRGPRTSVRANPVQSCSILILID